MNAPDNVAIDAGRREVFVAQFPTDAVLVFRSDVGGDVEPIRILHGPKTKLNRPIRVEVDPINNLLAVVNDSAILIFNLTDQGDVAPRWILSGPKTGIGTRFGTRDVKLFPGGKKIIALARVGGVPRPAETGGEDVGGGQRFIGVWNYGDNGDVAPWAVLNSTETTKIPGSRLALNPEAGELVVGGDGQVSVYHLPEIFQRTD